VAYLGEREHLVKILEVRHANGESQQHVSPFNRCLKPWELGEDFVHKTKIGILQYVPVRVFCSIITFATEYTEDFHEGDFIASAAYPYVAIAVNASQIWALYCLVLFYVCMKKELAPINPMPKFLCIKAVVFFTFWQSVAIAGLVLIGTIQPTADYTAGDQATGLQNFLVTIEMLLAAISHFYAFPYKEFYEENPAARVDMRSTLQKMGSIFHPKDLYHETKDVILRPHKKKKKKGKSDDGTPADQVQAGAVDPVIPQSPTQKPDDSLHAPEVPPSPTQNKAPEPSVPSASKAE